MTSFCRTHDTSPEDTGVNSSANESYTNDTFETETVQTTQARSVASESVAKNGTLQITKDGGLDTRPSKTTGKAPFSPTGRKGSESESDDSMTVPGTDRFYL